MNEYKAFYFGNTCLVYAESESDARAKALATLGAIPKRAWDIRVVLRQWLVTRTSVEGIQLAKVPRGHRE